MDKDAKSLLQSQFSKERADAVRRKALMRSVDNTHEEAFWDGYQQAMLAGIRIVNENSDRLTFISKAHDYLADISNKTVVGGGTYARDVRRRQEGHCAAYYVVLAHFKAL
jgi:hypothetical protein